MSPYYLAIKPHTPSNTITLTKPQTTILSFSTFEEARAQAQTFLNTNHLNTYIILHQSSILWRA